MRPYQDAATRQRIVAPLAGVAVDLKVTTVGSAIGPSERLMDIVPDNPELIVEAQTRPEDINHVRLDSDVDMRLTSFTQRITPTGSGKVTYVSADRLTDPATNMSYYMTRGRVNPESLAHAENLKLQAGMPAELYIKATERTPLLYRLDPVFGFVGRGMR